MKASQYLHFQSSVGRRLINVEEVVEVIPMVMLQREEADAQNKKFCGLMNFRGNIVPVFNLSGYEEETCIDVGNLLIVSHTEAGLVALLAREVDYLVNIEHDELTRVNPIGGEPFLVSKINNEMVRLVSANEFIQ